jgi:hypothetical protein
MDSASSAITLLSRKPGSSIVPNGAGSPSCAEVREQLGRLLDSSLFRTSRRYPGLLQFIVERKLDGQIGQLKERTLGVQVFGRRADYDTNQDPIVRVSAAEIRKRIAQYYHEPGRETELRIELPLGSYLPEFHLAAAAPVLTPPAGPSRTLAKKWWWLAVAACLSAATLSWVRTAPLDQFWQPLIQSNSPVSLCVARSAIESGHSGDTVNPASHSLNVDWPDVVTLARLTGLLQAKGLRYEIRREDQTSFNDLRQGPAILIGGFNNSWTLRLMNQGRFSLQREGSLCWIKDQQNPADRRWAIDLGRADERGVPILAQDFAIVSRVANPKTGDKLVLVAGLWEYGTQAAGEFLTKGRFLDALAAQAPAGWERKNMQVIIGTEVIDGTPGPPRILSVAFW